MSERRDYAAVAFTVSAIGLMVMAVLYQRQPPVVIAVDSIAITRPAFDSTATAVKDTATRALADSRAATGRARRAEAAAEAGQRVVDSLAALAVTLDSSAAAWEIAYREQRRVADSLRVVIAEEKEATAQAERSAIFYRAAYEADSTRRVAVERKNYDLRVQVAAMEPPCKIGPVKCPSRTVVGVVSLALGIAASK